MDLDDDILQDFLVEATEILERLDAELITLEQTPQDGDLLNSIFRGFHTIKGGAGFLGLTPLVEICHVSEDLFNVLRNGERIADSAVMDTVLQAFDVVQTMFEAIKAGDPLSTAEPGLIAALRALVEGEGVAPEPIDDPPPAAPVVEKAPPQVTPASDDEKLVGGDDISESEFEQLLDELHGEGKGPSASSRARSGSASTAAACASEDISEEEFDALLDELHGKGRGPASVASKSVPNEAITEEEFDQVLDQLHGKGKGPTTRSDSAAHSSLTAASQDLAPAPHAPPEEQATTIVGQKTADAAVAEKPKSETSVRVDTKRLDDIMNLVGELVLARNRLMSLRESIEDEAMLQAVANLDHVTADLQGSVMKTRMQPVKRVFGRFPRVVRDLARSLKKQVNLELIGEETDLDKNLVEALADPLVHLVRNAVDHGVEMPDVREAAGKPRAGRVMLSAEQEGDHILLTIADDGGGMDAKLLREKAVAKGLMDEDAVSRLSDKECYELIFAPGFSTKEAISDISGRGVGMDVVKTRISQLNGQIDIDSVLGKGTRLAIRVPLTLAIMPTLMVIVGDRTFALPLAIVNEIFELASKNTNVVDGQQVILNRGKAPPLFYLHKWLLTGGQAQPNSDSSQVIMVQVGNQSIGFVVDQVIGQEEVVIKPLGSLLHGTKGLAGATITGDGNIALILDVPSLMKMHVRR